MKGGVARNVSEGVAILDGGVDGKLTVLPPFISDREVAGLEAEIEIAEAIVREQAAVAEVRARFFAPNFFDQHFSVGQL